MAEKNPTLFPANILKPSQICNLFCENFQIFRKDVAVAEAGQNVGINLRNAKIDQLQKGMMLTKAASFVPTNHFEVIT